MVGYAGKSDRAEVNGVVIANSREAVVGHHLAVFGIVITTPGLFVKLELDIEFATRRLKYADPLRDDFLTDAISCDDGNFMFAYRIAQATLRLDFFGNVLPRARMSFLDLMRLLNP